MRWLRLVLLLTVQFLGMNAYSEEDYCSRMKLANSILGQCVDVSSCQQVCLFVVNTAKYIDSSNFKGYEYMQKMLQETNCKTLIRKDNLNEIFAWKNALTITSSQWTKGNC